MKRIIFSCIYSLTFILYTHAIDLKDSIMTPGVLAVRLDVLDSLNHHTNMELPIYIYSRNGEVFDSLIYSTEEHPKFANNIVARAYWPEHYILYFDSYPLYEGKYKVFCNEDWYFIPYIKNITEYLTWEQFIKRIPFFDTTIQNPIRINPSLNSAILDLDYDEVFFDAISIHQEWIYVNIFKGEDIFNPIGKGWLRWRSGNKLLIKENYFSI